MNVSIIGTGNVAYVLARLIKKNGHVIKQIIGRNEIEGVKLSQQVNADFIHFHVIPNKDIDICIVALSDAALPEALATFNFGNVLVLHTAGSFSMHILDTVSTNVGVLYPLQSLRKEMDNIPEIPFLIEASNIPALNNVEMFAKSLSNNVQFVEEAKRFRLHAAAVIVSNFTNYLYLVGETYCTNENVDFNLLKPLIKETAERIMLHSPKDVQTGPAKRGDIITLQKHLQLFEPYQKIKILYTRMTDSIMNG
jgi:predicted short-subunit dehydrogenase-like oxidoreductase (DUF2520 family)